MTRYWYINCPVCGQGRLFAQRRSDTGSLMLECEECSVAWARPEQAAAREGGFLAIDIPSAYATAAEIRAAGWSARDFQEATD